VEEGEPEHYYMDIGEKGGLKIMCMGVLTRPRDGPIYGKLLSKKKKIRAD